MTMVGLVKPSSLKADFNLITGRRDKAPYDGPIAVLVGPGTISAGDFGAVFARFHPRARLFGKTTAAPDLREMLTGNGIDGLA